MTLQFPRGAVSKCIIFLLTYARFVKALSVTHEDDPAISTDFTIQVYYSLHVRGLLRFDLLIETIPSIVLYMWLWLAGSFDVAGSSLEFELVTVPVVLLNE